MKKSYQAPKLVVYGSVESLTQTKTWGFADQFVIIRTVPNGGPSTGS